MAIVVPPDVVTAFGLKLLLLTSPSQTATQPPAAVLIRKDRHTARASDIILDYEAVVTPYTSTTSQTRAYSAPAKGVNICGSRSYTIDPTCSAFLTMFSYGTGTGDGYMYLRLYPTLST